MPLSAHKITTSSKSEYMLAAPVTVEFSGIKRGS
jgi:hypothetical protein